MSRMETIAVAGIMTFILGLAGGLAIGARSNRSPSAPAAPSSDALPATPERPPETTVRDDPKPAEEAPSRMIQVPPDTLKVAQELWDLMMSSDRTRAAHNERLARMRDVRPEMAEFFIRKWREAGSTIERQYAMEMAIACGGPRAVDFVRELAENPAEGFQEYMLRVAAADCLSRGHLLKRRPKEFPVDEALSQQTHVLLNSTRGTDRRLAVVILGHCDVHRALPAITERLQADPDPVVREEAVRQLGRVGNETSLAFLRSEGSLIADRIFATYVQPQPVPGGAPVRATDKREFLRVLNDAIEELEERLSAK
jgi:hypothetical protein